MEDQLRIFFADDSRQYKPSRPGMGPLVALGGISIPANEVGSTGNSIDDLCNDFGFPPNEEFKWSPGKELWMRGNLTGAKRKDFFEAVINILSKKEVIAVVIIEDSNSRPATGPYSTELDVTKMFLERVDRLCGRCGCQGLVVVDRLGGNREKEDAFLFECLETLQSGTTYVKPKHIAHNVLCTSSKLSRLLQVADIVTSCTLALASGEKRYAPPIFETIKPLFDKAMGRIGGYGLKIHPDYKYVNLYHWLLGDTVFWKLSSGWPLPLPGRPYGSDAFVP